MTVTLDLPIPFSVNMVRRIDWSAHKKRKKWIELADALIMASRQNRQNAIIGPFEAHIMVSDNTRTDLDNCVKVILDYCVRLKLVTDDSPDYLRKLVVEFGPVEGSRIVLKPFKEPCPHVHGWRRQQLVRFLFERRTPANIREIYEALYDSAPPEGRRLSIPTMRNQANKELEIQGWRITAVGSPCPSYQLVAIESVLEEGIRTGAKYGGLKEKAAPEGAA